MASLPGKCRRYLETRGLKFEVLEQGSQSALALKGVGLPRARYDSTNADVLIMLPEGYPDTAPDMFYTYPWLRLAANGSYPRAADQKLTFLGRDWQRWSRHSNQWRPGVDGIWTVIKRIEAALEAA